MRKVKIGVKHVPEMIGRPVWFGRKVGIVRSLDHTKLYVQFGMLPPVGIGAHRLYIACSNWDDRYKKCKGHVEPLWASHDCEKCAIERGIAERGIAERRRDDEYDY